MNTQKQIFLIITLSFVLVGGCAAYATIDLPIRAERQADFFVKESVERGALLYANNCRTCHGIQGEGGVGLPLNTEAFRDQSPLALEQNQEMIRRTISCGRAGTLMPAWLIDNGGALTENQIGHLVRMFTAPEDPVTEDGEEFANFGWAEAVHFAHNLNAESGVVLGGDTLSSIAAAHNIGPRELAEANGLEAGAALDAGTVLELPTGGTYEVEEGDTLDQVAADLNLGSVILAELNGLEYEIVEGVFVLTTTSDDPLLRLTEEQDETGLLPGSTLMLPEGAGYNAVVGDSLETIAEAHGVSVGEIEDLNTDALAELEYDSPDQELPLQSEDGELIELVLQLPQVDAYVVQGQSLADAADGYSNVSAESLAEANGIAADDQPVVGKSLEMPEDSWGTAPPSTVNDGAACIQHVVAQNIYDDITGGGAGFERPEEFSQEVSVTAGANDWTVTADGETQEPNAGSVLMATGTTVTFENTEGVHTITVDDETVVDVPDFPTGSTQTLTFDTAGEFDILCDLHPAMQARFYVEDAP